MDGDGGKVGIGHKRSTPRNKRAVGRKTSNTSQVRNDIFYLEQFQLRRACYDSGIDILFLKNRKRCGIAVWNVIGQRQ
jgi:hypothetical protein